MFRRPSRAALAALIPLLVLPVSVAFAGAGGEDHSAFALPMSDALAPVASGDPLASPAVASEFAVAPPDERAGFVSDQSTGFESRYVTGRRYESVTYRPRRGRHGDGGGWRWRAVTQLHAGFLDPDGPSDAGFLAGFRGGQQIDDMFQLGLGIDWRTKSGRATQVLQQSTGPGGETIVTRLEVSRYSSNLLPLLAYAQLSGPPSMLLVPYVGVAASWQVLFLEADDFATGQRFDATYDGFGWQLWGGAALPLSGRSKLVGEIFLNQATVGRDVFDPFLGQDIRETISTDGVGARFGMSWGF